MPFCHLLGQIAEPAAKNYSLKFVELRLGMRIYVVRNSSFDLFIPTLVFGDGHMKKLTVI